MSQQLVLNTKGIESHPSPFIAPPGAMEDAINVVIDRDGTIGTRRGQKRYGNILANNPEKIFFFNSRAIVHHGTTMSYDSDNAGTWTDYTGSYSAPTGHKMRSLSSNKNFYFTSSTGVKKIDTYTNDPVDVGTPKGLNADAALNADPTGFFAVDKQVAYRIVWGYKDDNDNLILGEPSERIEIANPSAGAVSNVDLTIYIPNAITTTYFYQIYRSGQSVNDDTPGDEEMGLVYESNPDSTDISNGYVTVTDQQPDELRGATIYIAPSQEGILKSNTLPPLCKDFTTYKNSVYYANTQTTHRFFIDLISAGNISATDTITIGGTVYTAIASTPGNNQFEVFSSGTVAENIADTARSLVKAVNVSTTNTTIVAYYISGFDDNPGRMRFENISASGSQFNFDASGSSIATAFNPTIPSGGLDSDNEVKVNRVYVSKKLEPEAVPILDYFDVGSEEFEIDRIIGLRDSVFIFKGDGVYRVIGEDINSLTVRLFDATAVIKGNESAVVFNNYIVLMTLLGICSVSDSGVTVLSRDIEDKILPLFNPDKYPNFDDLTFGVAYDSQKIFAIYTVKDEGASQTQQAFIYNSFTQTWTRWELGRTCGLVDIADDFLYQGGTDKYVYIERKELDRFDFADEDYDVTITSVASTPVINLVSSSQAVIGQSLRQGANAARITAVDTSANTITVEEDPGFIAGAATLNDAIQTTVEWLQQYTQNPSMIKVFREITYIFRDLTANITATYKSNYSSTPEEIEITPYVSTSEGGWGTGAWGSGLWGGASDDIGKTVRTFFPREKMRSQWVSVQISTNEAFSEFNLVGISIDFDNTSSRMK